jgi:hypothetical protein
MMTRNQLKRDSHCDDYDWRWTLAPVSIVLVSLALMQIFGIEPGLEQAAPTAPTAASPSMSSPTAEYPFVDGLTVPPDVAQAAPKVETESTLPAAVADGSTATEDNAIATF